MADPNQNILSLTIPTDVISGGGGGLTMNYNFGSNVDAIASGAYSFLGQQFAGAQAFEGQSIKGTQDFLTNAAMPIVNAVAGEADSYFSQLLSAFNSTSASQTNLGLHALDVQSSISNNSINTSGDAQSGGSILGSIFGGGCFITTAVCKYSGLPDDCDTLQTMRAWRDGWMQGTDERRAMVQAYYATAPLYVGAIECRADQKAIWRELSRLIMTACHHIKTGDNTLALAYYLAAVEFARVAAEQSA